MFLHDHGHETCETSMVWKVLGYLRYQETASEAWYGGSYFVENTKVSLKELKMTFYSEDIYQFHLLAHLHFQKMLAENKVHGKGRFH